MIQSVQKLLPCLTVVMPLAITISTATAQTAPAQTAPATGCVSGASNGTHQGDRPITRYEFAAGMNTCLNQVNQQLEFNKASFATRTDFDALIQQQRELNEQLRELSDRVGTISGDESPAR